jgi:hypothetical protein
MQSPLVWFFNLNVKVVLLKGKLSELVAVDTAPPFVPVFIILFEDVNVSSGALVISVKLPGPNTPVGPVMPVAPVGPV